MIYEGLTRVDADAVLAGRNVANTGLVQANLGQVVLAGVPAYFLDIVGDGLLTFALLILSAASIITTISRSWP